MSARKTKRKGSGVSLGVILAMVSCVLAGVAFWRLEASPTVELHSDNNLTAERLCEVTTNPSLPQQLVDYPGMWISFNSYMHQPNWVSWELTAGEVEGEEPRYDRFYCDENVEGCPETYDYKYSGFDRGHMCPAGDMKWSEASMIASFSLANICPQAKSLNTGAWKKLEEKCRKWASIDGSIIIVCGPILTDTDIREFIGDSRVAVPKRFFKVILSPTANPVRGIGFIMPNDKVVGGMQASAVSIDEVEKHTGHDFFSALPDDVEAEVERQCDFHYWSTLKKKEI